MNIEIISQTPQTEYGCFLNPKGYKAPWDHNEGIIFKKAIFEFSLESPPLMFKDKSDDIWMTDRHFFTDWGSIPTILQPIIPKDLYLGYLFHDSAYGHHGLWVCRKSQNIFIFQPLTMTESNKLLYEMMLAQNALSLTANTVYYTLQSMGYFAWTNAERRNRAGTQNK